MDIFSGASRGWIIFIFLTLLLILPAETFIQLYRCSVLVFSVILMFICKEYTTGEMCYISLFCVVFFYSFGLMCVLVSTYQFNQVFADQINMFLNCMNINFAIYPTRISNDITLGVIMFP